ncbi:hypothetical protein [Ramlibacter sp.]|uniref:hypothetical protein n=1 Tax=Ramlibacter sp. TaxID=1917967 RepID=UPI002C3779F9|nr:hypothetical protein [Ramlibacter sp.]HWI82404.1 hypothetical protein [Ramlibacter sp.]
MATSDFIAANFGVSMAQARDFIMSHVTDPGYIYNLATQYHVTSDMLGEITGYASTQVEGFFTAYGMDGTALRPAPTGTTGAHLLVLDGSSIPDVIVKLDTYGGELSTASLHAAIVARTGQAAYDAAFSAAPYDTDHNGVLSASELGTSALGTLPATVATIESIFFGTVINAFKSLDQSELTSLGSFAETNAAAIGAGDPGTMQQLVSMMLAAMSTPAATPVLSDAMIAQAIVEPAAALIGTVGSAGSESLFDVLLSF